jgi:peptidyl-prolyl cis-trans isomerase C
LTDKTEQVRRWPVLLREPLVHFILAALAVFIGWHFVSSGRSRRSADDTGLQRRPRTPGFHLYGGVGQPCPTGEDMVAMVNDYVRDEALAREARRLGLDEGDTIVTRRLAQKMTFMVADLARDGNT